MKILIIKNDGIGDLILSSGLISYIAANIATSLDLITCNENKAIATHIEGVNEIFYVSRDSIKQYTLLNKNRIQVPLRRANDHCKIIRFTEYEQEVITKTNQKNYDLIIVLRRYIRQSSLNLLHMIRAKEKLCMWERPMNISYESAKKLSTGALHITTFHLGTYIRPELEYYEAVLSKYFQHKIIANPFLNCVSYQKTDETQKIGLILSGSSIKISTKQWLHICRHIVALGYRITLFGAKEQHVCASRIEAEFPCIENRVGSLSLEQYPEAFSSVSCIIGNDTGLTHYASLYHSKVLVFLGGGTFRSFFPWREEGPQEIAYHEMECYDCAWICDKQYACISSLMDDTPLLYNAITLFLSQLK